MVVIEEEDYLAHYGILRRSGRYPWGSGGNVTARSRTFLDIVEGLEKEGLSQKAIAESQGLSIRDLRYMKSIAKNQIKREQIDQAWKLHEKGHANTVIAQKMGLAGESSVRALLREGERDKAEKLTSIANMLKRAVEQNTYVDVGAGIELHLNVKTDDLGKALVMLRDEGYEIVPGVKIPQLGTGKETNMLVLAPPGTTWGDVQRNRYSIRPPVEFSEDGGRSFKAIQPPLAIDPKRVAVNWKEDGGDLADGVIYVREGVPDLSLGNSRYAQVRIQVGDGHYMKGMAIYKDDLPPGVDLVYNTPKSSTGNKFDAFKPLERNKLTGEVDTVLPFGSVVRQQIDDSGKVTSVMNLMGTKETSGIEGGWDEWTKTLSSQMLSKQPPSLAKEQLAKTYDQRKKEFDEIMALTNPVVKNKLLLEFAEATDAAAVHLKAAHMPRQQTKVILPINSLKPNEVYAPSFHPGEQVVLVRYPHGGRFEIPELTVNNKNREAKGLLGDAMDAIGINKQVADQLSGADFDGDTVIVIPNNNRKIRTASPLQGLKDFDAKAMYPEYPGMKLMDARTMQAEMGKISNLITDMTIRKASHEEIARAVKHSMVVIDAKKHRLNYRKSEIDHGIAALKEKYQGGKTAGASTLISRARSQKRLPELKDRPAKEGGPFDTTTGQRVRVPTGRMQINRKTGEKEPFEAKYHKLDLTEDAHSLSSGTPIEKIYADHSNKLKSLANQARLETLKTPKTTASSSAKKVYSEQVASLDAKLTLARRNAPRERQAQIVAGAKMKALRDANPDLEKEQLKKLKWQTLEESRIRMKAKKDRIVITEDEWNAIQAGAVSPSKLNDILTHADMDVVKTLATPRTQLLMTPSKVTRARSMLNNGFTRAEVASALGVSLTTLDNSMKV